MSAGNGRATALDRITPEVRRLERAGDEEQADALRTMAQILDDFAHEMRTGFDTVSKELAENRSSLNRVWVGLVLAAFAMLTLAYSIGQAQG